MNHISRRQALTTLASATALSVLPRAAAVEAKAAAPEPRGKLRHSACRWCYSKIPMESFAQAAVEIGLESIEVICFSGNREKWSDEQGLENCAKGLQRLMALAEKLGVTLVMELLNSKVNHKDYMCDRTAWGVELCKKRVGSERFKLLYDIYHMQIMEGDVIAPSASITTPPSPTTTPAASPAAPRSTRRRS
jgi:sugar phosphate isomerase/epimerase